jgi:hypothetical protein
MKKLIGWCSGNIPAILTIFLLIFIPLYPKLPTVDIYGTWVSVRLEDFAVVIALIYLGIRFLRDRTIARTGLTAPILLYWIVGAISLAWSILFIGKHLANYFPHLAVLHYLRRIEYMVLFFLAYNAARKGKNLPVFIGVISVTVIGVILYGLGQKFLGWPAYLTMNEEFAKGIPLRLPPTARIPSTFGGHYDLAAYLVLMIPIFGSLAVGIRKIIPRLFFTILALSSLTLLLLTASRVSFGVYLVSITVMLIWQKKYLLIFPVVVLSFFMLNLVSTASDRFYKTFRYSDVIVDLSTGQPIGTLDKLEGQIAYVEPQENPGEEELPKGSQFINVPQSTAPSQSVKTIEVFSKSDLATGSGEIATISGSFLIQKALVYDISITTRFQGQWPKAIEAFRRNLLLGSGYSTLSVATDGDYLRMLGETGILGAFSFIGIFVAAFYMFLRSREPGTLRGAFVVGVFAGIVGLFLNAILIDVFEASKVAFTTWMLLGFAVAVMDDSGIKYPKYLHILRYVFTRPLALVIYLVACIWIVYGSAMNLYFVGDDFTWLRWAATSTGSDISRYFTESEGFFWRPIPKLWYFLLYSIFWLKAGSYHLITLSIYCLSAILIYAVLTERGVRRGMAWIGALLFGVLSVHHENIFWISGHSTLLATLFFYFSIWVFFVHWRIIGWKKWASLLLGSAALAISMLSYEGLVTAPIAIWILSFALGKKKWWHYLWLVVFSPLYLYLRMLAGAIGENGDYAYNRAKFPINSLVNLAGYAVSIPFGYSLIEYFQGLRQLFRAQMQIVVVSAICIGGLLSYLIWRARTSLLQYGEVLIWGIVTLVMLLPYLGLGGITERYALTSSGLMVIGVTYLANILILRIRNPILNSLVYVVFIGLILLNAFQVQRVSRDWEMAHTVSKQTLLTMKQQFFPLRIPTLFVIVNQPIRYGRAWIYPTGLTDALWHLFRGNPYTIIETDSLEKAFENQIKGAMYVLTFEDYVMKLVTKSTLVVP